MPMLDFINGLERRALRYRLYRIKNGNPVESGDNIKEFFEVQDGFDGWENFTFTWDVLKIHGNWAIVDRYRSVYECYERDFAGCDESICKHDQEEI